MKSPSPARWVLAAAVFLLLAGGGGLAYLWTLVGGARPAGPAVFVPATRTPLPASATAPLIAALQPSGSPAATSPVLRLTLDWTVEPSETLAFTATASATATATPTPSASATATASPTATVTPVPGFNGLPSSAYLPAISDRARAIYQAGLRLGNNPRSFSRLGDCHSSTPGFLGSFDTPGAYRLGAYAYLQSVVDYFHGAFSGPSQAAYAGLNIGSFFSPLWARPEFCQSGENVMDCEYRRYHPSIIFINVGTLNDQSSDAEFERYVRPIIDYWIAKGVVPILNTKADNIEGGDRFNNVIRRLAADYDLPLWDFAAVAHSLPRSGLQADNVHLADGLPYFDDPSQLISGWAVRNLTGLQALDIVWRGLGG